MFVRYQVSANRTSVAGAVAALFLASPTWGANLQLDVDASHIARRILHSHVTIPVTGTRITLYYPKWSPGDHAPLNRVTQLTDLVIRAGGKPIPWRRSRLDAFTFEVEVPRGTTSIDADFDIRMPAPGHPLGGASARILRLRWDIAVLYPAGKPVQQQPVDASLRLPAGWSMASALPVRDRSAETTRFATANLDQVIDSPVLAGLHMRTADLTPGSATAHRMSVAAETPDDLPEQGQLGNYSRLIAEAQAMFRSEHFSNYHFLVAASDYTGPGAGFEHAESSDTGVRANFFHPSDAPRGASELLPHEYAHSWSGIYRRPAGLMLPDYQQPAQTDLLWVYEGVTAHVGYVLTSRSGWWNAEQAREFWAGVAAKMAAANGRTWRNLQDTADSVPVTMPAQFTGDDWNSWLRGLDYYEEGALIWLEAGAIIHAQTGGMRSLDDFLAAFYGGKGGTATVKSYTAKDVFDTLGRIAPYDWAGFFDARLTSLAPTPPLDGLTRSGWRLAYDAKPNPFVSPSQMTMFTLGIQAGGDGTIHDVDRSSAPYAAGIVPGMKIVKVNGKDWSAKEFRQILTAARPGDQLVLNTTYAGVSQEFQVAAGSGLRYPHLERIAGTPDLLTPYLAPHVSSVQTP